MPCGFYEKPILLVFSQVAVEKYEEVLHNLAFAQEIHKTLESLTRNVIHFGSMATLHFGVFFK